MQQHSIEPSTRKYVFKDMDLYHLQENIKNSYWIED